jgi:hypothetical protein
VSFLSPASAILWYAMAIAAVDNEVADPPCYELSVLRTRGHEAEDRAGECDRDLYDINYAEPLGGISRSAMAQWAGQPRIKGSSETMRMIMLTFSLIGIQYVDHKLQCAGADSY